MPTQIICVETQFPNFDNLAIFNSLLQAIPAARDASWSYDTSPCIRAPGVEIWIDFATVERRENKEAMTFAVYILDEFDTPTGAFFETDSVSDVIRFSILFVPQPKQLDLFSREINYFPTIDNITHNVL